MLLFGKFKAPLTYRLVVEALVIRSFTITLDVAKKLVLVILTASTLAGLKFVAEKLVTFSVVKKPLVEVMEVAITIVEVTAVPDALVNMSGPVKVPPASGR